MRIESINHLHMLLTLLILIKNIFSYLESAYKKCLREE